MSFVSDVVSGITGAVGDVIGGVTGTTAAGEQAAAASTQAANIQAQSQQAALDYYKELMAPTLQAQQTAMPLYTQAVLDPTAALEAATSSPLYQAQLQAAQESALRGLSATGGLRSGQSVSTLADVGQNAQMNAYNSYMSGLANLAGLDTGAANIANMMTGIGQTQASGLTAAAQAQQSAAGQNASTLTGLLSAGALAFSDEKLKDSVVMVSNTNHPAIKFYSWKWNDTANSLGEYGNDDGYLAGEVESIWPELVSMHESGYKQINKQEVERRLEKLNG